MTDALNEENEDDVMAFAVDASLKDVVTKLSQAYYTLANVFYTPDTNLSDVPARASTGASRACG